MTRGVWSRHWFEIVESELIVDKVVRRFCFSFLCSVYSFSRSCPKTVSRTREVFPTGSTTLLRLQLSRTGDCARRSRHVGLLLFLFCSLLLSFLVKFQLALFVLSSQAMELEIMEAIRSFPLQFSFKARTVFFCLLLCSMRHCESVEGVLPSEGVWKFSKCLPAFPYAWPFLDRTTFTVLCCSCSLGLRLCDSFRPCRKLSDIDASAGLCTATSRPHTSTPYTLYARIHIVKERCLAWPRGR